MSCTKVRHLPQIHNFAWNAAGNAAYSFTSLFYLIFAARILGKDGAGPFAIAFTTSTILLCLGLYGIRNYQVTDIHSVHSTGSYITARLLTSSLMLPAGLIFCLLSGYGSEKTWLVVLLLLGKTAESMSDVFYGIMQKNGRLHLAGISMTVRSILSVIMFYAGLKITHNLLWAAALLSLCAFLTLFTIDIPCARKIEPIHLSADKAAWTRLLRICFPVFAAAIISAVLTNMPKYAIDAVMEDRYQTVYGIIAMPGTAILLFSQIMTQFFLTKMAEFSDDLKPGRFIKLNVAIIAAMTLFTGGCLLFFFFWGNDFLSVIYNTDVMEYIPDLLIILCGALFGSIACLLSAALTSLRITRIQLYIFLVNLVCAVIFSALLIPDSGLLGAAFAYLLIMLVQLVLYLAIFIYALFSRKSTPFCRKDSQLRN